MVIIEETDKRRKLVKEGVDDYRIVRVTSDVAVPLDYKIDNIAYTVIYDAIAKGLYKIGLEMAGTEVVIDEDPLFTTIYRDNDYESDFS